jgi:hypothetical protein
VTVFGESAGGNLGAVLPTTSDVRCWGSNIISHPRMLLDHACSLEVSNRVPNNIPLRESTFLPVDTVHYIATLKAINEAVRGTPLFTRVISESGTQGIASGWLNTTVAAASGTAWATGVGCVTGGVVDLACLRVPCSPPPSSQPPLATAAALKRHASGCRARLVIRSVLRKVCFHSGCKCCSCLQPTSLRSFPCHAAVYSLTNRHLVWYLNTAGHSSGSFYRTSIPLTAGGSPASL